MQIFKEIEGRIASFGSRPKPDKDASSMLVDPPHTLGLMESLVIVELINTDLIDLAEQGEAYIRQTSSTSSAKVLHAEGAHRSKRQGIWKLPT